MKKLLIARHAKSSREDPFLPDKERGLSKRGKHDLIEMSKRIENQDLHIDLLYTSPAKRARKTALQYAKTCRVKKRCILEKEKLYHSSTELLIKLIESTPESVQTLMLLGHNPELTELVNICGHPLDNLPTCGIAVFSYTGQTRGYFEPKQCHFDVYMAPKLLKNDD